MVAVDDRPPETVKGSKPETLSGTEVPEPDRTVNQKNDEFALHMAIGEIVRMLTCLPR